MMTMKSTVMVLAAVVGAAMSAREASASNWSSPGSGCVVRPSDASKAEMDPIRGTVKFAPGQSGTIKLTCPVTAFFNDETQGTPNGFYMTMADGDGYGTSCNLWSNLQRESTGSTTAFSSLAGISASSSQIANSPYQDVTYRQQAFDGFTTTWDSWQWHYWVIIELYRAPTASCNVTVWGTGLLSLID